MKKEVSGSPKVHTSVDVRRRNLSWIFGTTGLCFFFYMLGGWQNGSTVKIDSTRVQLTNCISTSKPATATVEVSNDRLDFTTHHSSGEEDESLSLKPLESCGIEYSEYTPCEDIQRSLKFDRDRLIYRERHCPSNDERLMCLIPAPPAYKNPFPWPKSRDFAWYANVPHKELTVEKAVQNWIQFEGDRFRFPGGGTMFPRGADAYIDDINALIPLTDGSIRTALDTGCGVASFGAFLLSRNVLTMSFAPRDTHEGQVQFALERGVPAMLGVMASLRLPYPARAFDLAHCSRCLIPWKDYDGVYLMEIDRVLRAGGYWILSGPPVNWQTHWKGWERSKEDLFAEMSSIEAMAKNLCWKKIVQKGNLAIWQKPINHVSCIRFKKLQQQQQQQQQQPLCPNPNNNSNNKPDEGWYTKMEKCITRLPQVKEKGEVAGGKLATWPDRATAVPPRVERSGMVEKFREDSQLWEERLKYYKRAVVSTEKWEGRYRNIMDMNAGIFGGFASALRNEDVWVMNAVSPNSSYSLGVIYERGFIGTYQDWCEAFSTYPRTYDMIHADRIFSTYGERCEMVHILLEMDRILRAEGAVIIRDDVEVLFKVERIVNGMRWESKMIDHESGPFNKEKILVAVKSYWLLDKNS